MKPATQKLDATIWRLWKQAGIPPKDIPTHVSVQSVSAVYNALHRERRRRGLPLRRGIGRPKKEEKS